MSLPLNPLNITGPSWPGNYIQPNVVNNPVISSNVANYPVGADVLGVASSPLPRAKYVQPDYAPKPNHAAFPLGDGNG